MASLAVVILTKNEEKHISEAINSAKAYATEVLIVDAGSTDGTIELAKSLGARTCYRQWDADFSAQRNFALTQTAADWIFYLDADERLTPETGEALKNIIASSSQVQGKIKRLNIAFGHQFEHGAFGPDEVIRLFPRNEVKWVQKVHERPECNLSMVTLPGALHHYTYDSWQQWWDKAGKYTTIWAEDKYAQGKRTSLAGAVLHTVAGAFKVFIIQGGILEGYMGLVSSWQHGVYTLSKYMKLLELQRKNADK
jgi:glycosyltransferase involved in cell wall biosynthesis